MNKKIFKSLDIKLAVIMIAVILAAAISQSAQLNNDWGKLTSRCPIASAIIAKNIARFGIVNITPAQFFAVGDYPISREFDVPMINHPILNSLICAGFFKIFGVSVWASKLWALSLGMLILLLLMLLTWRLFSDRLMVLVAGLIGAFVPISFYYNHYLDNWWSDVFYVLTIVFLYHGVLKDDFRRVSLRILLYIFTFLGCSNSWRLFALPPLLILHAVLAVKLKGEGIPAGRMRFIKEYALLGAVILALGFSYLRYLFGHDLAWSIKNIYLKTEFKSQSGFSFSEWWQRYFLIQRNCYTPVVYAASAAGLGMFFFSKKAEFSDKLLLACVILWGFVSGVFLIDHLPYIYSLHNAFYIPIIVLASFCLVKASRWITEGSRLFTITLLALFLGLFMFSCKNYFQRWPLHSFPVWQYETIINRNTSPADIIGTNIDLTGQHDFSSDMRNPINLHNMFLMDREINIIRSTDELLKDGTAYKYFLFDYNRNSISGPEKELFDYLKGHLRLCLKEGSFYLFSRR